MPQLLLRWLLSLLLPLRLPPPPLLRCRCCVTDCPSILLRAPASGCTRSRSTEQESPSIIVRRAHRASPLFRDAEACSLLGHMSCHIMGMAWYRMAETLAVDSAARMCGTVRNCTGLYRLYRT